MILEASEDRYRKSSKLFVEVAHELLILDAAFFSTSNEFSLAKVGGALIHDSRQHIIKKRLTFKKIEEMMNYFSSNLSLMMRERIEKKLNVCKLADTSGARRLAALGDALLSVIVHEVMCAGTLFPLEWAGNLADMLRQCFLCVAPGETR